MSTVLITGGVGFIGFHLASRLLDRGSTVRVLDNLDPFYDPRLKLQNADDLRDLGGSRFEFVEGDLRDPEACRKAVEGCDVVVHLAALAGVRPSIREPDRYMDVNVTGTQRLLDQIGSSAVPVVFGSSSSVYGGNKQVPFSESHAVDHPVSPYAASKKAGEVLMHAFHHLRGNPVTCLRFFTVFGPRQRPEMAIHKFTRHIVDGEPLPFFGDGKTRRDYTFVEDIVAGIDAAIERAQGYSIYNLGGSATTSLEALVSMLEQALGKKAVLDRQPDQPGDVQQTFADISLAERELGYRCSVPVSEGIERFCDWYLQQHAAGRL